MQFVAAAPQSGLADQFELAGDAVIFDAIGKALDEFIAAVGFLAERHGAADCTDLVEPVRILGHLHAIGA